MKNLRLVTLAMYLLTSISCKKNSDINTDIKTQTNPISLLLPWPKTIGGTGDESGSGISTDANGNVFVTGWFSSPSITFGSTTLINRRVAGTPTDIFVVKYDPSGNLLWAKSAGGNGNDISSGISTDANGNVLVTGYFESAFIIFGTDTLTKTSAGGREIFVVKYDASGNILWAKAAEGNFSNQGDAISTDASGNVFITGSFSSDTIVFGSVALTNTNSWHNPDIFVVKYDAAGNVLWAKSAGGSYDDYGSGISTEASGNVYITGRFASPSIAFGSTTLINAHVYESDIFVVKYDAAGNVIWAKSAGGANDDFGNGLSIDPSGNVLLTGFFRSSTITFGSTIIANSGIQDVFVVKYDASGNVIWAKSAGGNKTDISGGISNDGNGNVFVTGYFNSPSISFGPISLTVTNPGASDIFVAKLDALGNVIWAIKAAGTGVEYGEAICNDASGNAFITGLSSSPTITFGATTLTNTGSIDIFVAKY
jgi:hypothetical protein